MIDAVTQFRYGIIPNMDVGGYSVPTNVIFPAAAAVLYILMICFRKHLKMKIPLWFVLFHNAAMIALALLVLVGTLLGANERSMDPSLGGAAGLFCPPENLKPDQLLTGTLGFFVYIFHLSKYLELIDTFILIAKGSDLIFLHCYHHCIMLFVTWSWFAFPYLEGAWWCAVVNSIIHSLMYYYYLQSARGIKVLWKKHLTSAQLFQVRLPPLSPSSAWRLCFNALTICVLQFFTGMVVVAYSFYRGNCSGDKRTGLFSTAVNVSFFALFLGFFKTKYVEPKDGKKIPGKDGNKSLGKKEK
jgi:hypothetical protein